VDCTIARKCSKENKSKSGWWWKEKEVASLMRKKVELRKARLYGIFWR
jgi:hypothetical protein